MDLFGLKVIFITTLVFIPLKWPPARWPSVIQQGIFDNPLLAVLRPQVIERLHRGRIQCLS